MNKYLIIISILVISSIIVGLYEKPVEMEDLKWGENNAKCIKEFFITIEQDGVITGNTTFFYNHCRF